MLGFIAVPGLRDQVLGMRKGDEKALEPVTLEDEFPVEDLRGREVTPKVSITEIRKLQVPPLTDDTAKRIGFDTLEELKNHTRQSMEQRREDLEKEQMRRQIADWLLEKNPIVLPQRLLQRQTDENIRRTQVRLLRQGFSVQDITQLQERIVESSKESAESGLKLALFLKWIGDEEKIYVTEDEVDAHIRELAAREEMTDTNMKRALEKYELDRTIRSSLREDKVYGFMIDKAEVTEVEAPEAKESEEQK
jgi:trigger factor